MWSVRLFDVYRGAPVPADDVRSLAFAVRLQATDHTLTDAEVADARRALIDAVESTPRRPPPRLSTAPADSSACIVMQAAV